MAIAKTNSLFFMNHQNCLSDQYGMDCPSHIESIEWFAQMSRDADLNVNEVSDVLSKLEDFQDQKEFEKAEIVAELQLASAFQELLEEKQTELTESITCKK